MGENWAQQPIVAVLFVPKFGSMKYCVFEMFQIESINNFGWNVDQQLFELMNRGVNKLYLILMIWKVIEWRQKMSDSQVKSNFVSLAHRESIIILTEYEMETVVFFWLCVTFYSWL